MQDKYRFIGPVYDLLSTLYSGKTIQHCKVANVNPENIRPGDKVLFAGVGHGRDALAAAALGAEVTVVDLSETMLRKFAETQASEGPDVEIQSIHSDIMKVDHPGQYDVVVANFFLNVFQEQQMQEVLSHLISQIRPGGQLIIGDFCYPTGNILSQWIRKAYWYAALGTFWLLANNPMHKIYNYPDYVSGMGLQIQDRKQFRLMGMDCYWSILARKPEAGEFSQTANS